MDDRTEEVSVWNLVLLGLLAGHACLVLVPEPIFAGENRPAYSTEPPMSSAAVVSPSPSHEPLVVGQGASDGMTIYIDPQTGAILKQPIPGSVPLAVTPRIQKAYSTSHQGLVEVPSATPGAGVKVDLDGRFRSLLFATTDDNGKARILHLHEMPDSVDSR